MLQQSDLFRMEVFVSGKNLAEVLRRLSGVATQVTTPVPVVEETRDGADVFVLFQRWLDHHQMSEVTTAMVRDFQTSIGRAPGGANYVIQGAMLRGMLKKKPGGRRDGYLVARRALPSPKKVR